MNKINIFKDKIEGLQKFEDDRGIIADVFYKKPLEHVALIKSEPNTIRGNHFHKETTQHMLITQGSLDYWFKNVNDVNIWIKKHEILNFYYPIKIQIKTKWGQFLCYFERKENIN